MMKKLQLLGLSLFTGCLSLIAQTTHNIDWSTQVGANASLTVNVGDEIVWTVTDQVTHDVVSSDINAPAGFGSGDLTAIGQTYSFIFTSATIFDYFCSYHEGSMFGTITVEATAGLEEESIEGLSLYPNPASDILNLNAEEDIKSVAVYNMMSQEVLNHTPSNLTNSVELNVSNLENGSYFIKVGSGDKVGIYKFIKK